MIKKDRLISISILVISLLIGMVGCSKPQDTSTNNTDTNQNNNTSNSITNDIVIGFYEGTLNQSGQNVLTSLTIKEGSKYEFYVSTIGLMDKGSYEMKENNIKFTSEMTSVEETGTYDNGKITSKFAVNGTSSDLSFDQVGSPDDFYKYFLGDYIAPGSNNDIVVLSLRENKMFEIASTDNKGSFDIIDGKIHLISESNTELGIGDFDIVNKSIKITLSLDNTKIEYVFNQNSEENNLTYYGASTKGMSGNTPVTLIIKPANRFEIVTSKPRGIGVYEIGKQVYGGFEIILTYTDPEKRPDGRPFTMAGTISNKNINDASTIIVLEQVEYQVDMGSGTLSTMNLGKIEFSLTPLEEKVTEQAKEEKPTDTTKTEETKKEETKKEEPKDDKKDESINVVGQYVTTVMGTTEVIIDLKADGSYELGTGEVGTYVVATDGKITFTPTTEGREVYETTYDTATESFTIKFSIINGTPASEYVFTKK